MLKKADLELIGLAVLGGDVEDRRNDLHLHALDDRRGH